MSAEELTVWEDRLAQHTVAVEGRTTSEGGGFSLCFRDYDGHLLELATPGIWAIY